MKCCLLIIAVLCTLSSYPMETSQTIPGSVELQPVIHSHVIELREHIVERATADCGCSKEIVCGLGALSCLAGLVIWLLVKTAPHW